MIPREQWNGILLGYKLTVVMFTKSGKEVLGAEQYEVVFDMFTFYYKVTNLTNYATYHVRVVGFTAAGDGPCPNLPASKFVYKTLSKGRIEPIAYDKKAIPFFKNLNLLQDAFD